MRGRAGAAIVRRMNAPPLATLFGPAESRHPVILSVPHAGRRWTPAMLAAAAHPVEELVALEDRHADRLVDAAVAAGFTALVAHTPRAWVDLNRAPDDLDWPRLTGEAVAEVSARAAAGIGVVPDRIAGLGAIWRAPLSRQEVAARVAAHHAPWHDRLAALIDRTVDDHGEALVIDVHSMPASGRGGAEMVLGTRRGRSVGARWVRVARQALATRGRRVAVDRPYAGAHIAERHGRPAERRHVLQLEVCRSTYLDRAADEPSAGLARAQANVLAVARALSDRMALPIAAE